MNREDYYKDDLRKSNWLGEVVDIDDPKKEGRVKVKVFGKFDELTNEFIPWAIPATRITGGSKSGSGFYSPPKLGSVVGVSFDNGNLYEPEYHYNEHISDELKSEISNSYANAHSLIYDTITEGSLKIFFTEERGLMFDYKSVQINIKPDQSIFITNPNADIIELKNDGNHTITLSKDFNLTCDNATIKVNKNAIIDCKEATVKASSKATIDSPSIKLGKSAAEAIIKGNTFQPIYNAHTHPTPTGVSGPPIILLTGTELSKVSKTE